MNMVQKMVPNKSILMWVVFTDLRAYQKIENPFYDTSKTESVKLCVFSKFMSVLLFISISGDLTHRYNF